MGLGEAVWADFCCKMNSKTNPMDLDRFGRDPADRKSGKYNIFHKIDSELALAMAIASSLSQPYSQATRRGDVMTFR